MAVAVVLSPRLLCVLCGAGSGSVRARAGGGYENVVEGVLGSGSGVDSVDAGYGAVEGARPISLLATVPPKVCAKWCPIARPPSREDMSNSTVDGGGEGATRGMWTWLWLRYADGGGWGGEGGRGGGEGGFAAGWGAGRMGASCCWIGAIGAEIGGDVARRGGAGEIARDVTSGGGCGECAREVTIGG